jgi:hypothetical protein
LKIKWKGVQPFPLEMGILLQRSMSDRGRVRLGGIHYTTLVAMVEDARTESSDFSTMDVLDDETIRVSGSQTGDVQLDVR